MSRSMLSTLALAATLLAGACTEDAAPTTGASSRLAPDEPAARHRGRHGGDRDRGDRPDRAEMEARRAAHHQAMLDRFDADHDGALSADERASAHLARVTERIAMLEEWVQAGLQPHRTYLFDLPSEEAARRRAGARAPDRFELEDLAFFERVREGYRQRVRQDPGRFVTIDARQGIDEIRRTLQQSVDAITGA